MYDDLDDNTLYELIEALKRTLAERELQRLTTAVRAAVARLEPFDAVPVTAYFGVTWSKDGPKYSAQMQLFDERDLLIDELHMYADLDISGPLSCLSEMRWVLTPIEISLR